MKLREEFSVPYGVAEVWQFFEQPTAVAGCMPGVESVSVVDADNVQVRVTQGIGPMTATFEASVTVTERVPNELIRFRAVGRSVRGAVGNLRTENAVHLAPAGEGTSVTVEGDVVLAGAIGSVGQKVVARQAGKVTAEFAGNLQRALAGEAPASLAPAGPGTAGPGAPGAEAASSGAMPSAGAGPAAQPLVPALASSSPSSASAERWAKVAAALSALSVVASLLALLRQRRRERP